MKLTRAKLQMGPTHAWCPPSGLTYDLLARMIPTASTLWFGPINLLKAWLR